MIDHDLQLVLCHYREVQSILVVGLDEGNALLQFLWETIHDGLHDRGILPALLFPGHCLVVFLAPGNILLLNTGDEAGTDGDTHLSVGLALAVVICEDDLALLPIVHSGHTIGCVILPSREVLDLKSESKALLLESVESWV